MVKSKSYSRILEELHARKKWEANSAKAFADATCSVCHRKLALMGRSRINGVCAMCVLQSSHPDGPKDL